MKDGKVIQDNAPRIDFDNLCGRNDFAKLTDNFSRKGIQALIWSLPNDIIRLYVKRAISLQKKIDSNPTDEEFDDLLEQQILLNMRFKNVLCSLSTLNENDKKEKDKTLQAAKQNLINELSPIFFGDEEAAKEYVTNMSKINDNTEKAQYTAELVNAKIISKGSCKTPLWTVLHTHNIYTPGYNNWTKCMNREITLSKLENQKRNHQTKEAM